MYQPCPGSDIQLPETQRRPAPASVRTAVNAMYAGAVTSLLGIGIGTISDTKTAIARRFPDMTASQLSSTQHVLIAGFVAGGAIAAVVWIVLARACQRGHNWARITGTVTWLAGLAAVVFLWRRDSSAYFRPRP